MPPLEFGTIRGFGDFRAALLRAGFAVGGENDEGIFSFVPIWTHPCNIIPATPKPIPGSGVSECSKTGLLPAARCFPAKRAGYPGVVSAFPGGPPPGKSLEELYADGLVSRLDREVYRTVAGAGLLPVHKLRERISCDKPSQIEAALSRLQAGLFLTVCGETRKLSKDGRPYGWPVSLVCTPEAFFPEDVWGESSGYHRGGICPDPGAGAPPESAGGRKAYSPLHRRMNPTMAAYLELPGIERDCIYAEQTDRQRRQGTQFENVDIEIPGTSWWCLPACRDRGKSSLAFDTIYAEGQRRYVESLSSYARQFLGQMEKPDVDYIEGLSPAISIDQKTTSKNPRSTVGTVTEIYDYLRLLYARIGIPHCPICGREIKQQTVDQIVDRVMALEEGTRIQVLAPVVRGRKGEHAKEFRGGPEIRICPGAGGRQCLRPVRNHPNGEE